MQILQNRIEDFQRRTFATQSTAAKLAHLAKEVEELRAAPGDITEWADCLILLLGAAAWQGIKCPELIAAAHAKLDINERRKWIGPDAEGVYHHA